MSDSDKTTGGSGEFSRAPPASSPSEPIIEVMGVRSS
jgi:hypothetical protein